MTGFSLGVVIACSVNISWCLLGIGTIFRRVEDLQRVEEDYDNSGVTIGQTRKQNGSLMTVLARNHWTQGSSLDHNGLPQVPRISPSSYYSRWCSRLRRSTKQGDQWPHRMQKVPNILETEMCVCVCVCVKQVS